MDPENTLKIREDLSTPIFWEFLKDTTENYTGFYDLNTMRYMLEEYSKDIADEYYAQ